MKKNDRRLLRQALLSNGGGVVEDNYSAASVARMRKAGLIQDKPNQYRGTGIYWHLLTLTDAGREAAMELKETT